MGVDPSLYDDIGRTASVASPLDGLRQEPSGPSSSSPQPLTWGQEKLERLDSLRQRCEALIETNPRLAVAGEVLLTSIGYCLQAAVYIKAGVEGAAVGGMVGGPPGAIVGGAVGIMAAYGTGQVMATAVEAGTEKLASTMASQGSTAEQMDRFARTGEWVAKSAGMLALLVGARKAATKWGHVGKPDMVPQWKGIELTLQYKEGMDLRDFGRKTSALQDLAERGKLKKSDAVRDKTITKEYRENILKSAERQWGKSEPQRAQRITRILKKLDADHLHELQLGGIDHRSSLWLLDKPVNRSFGAQIQRQLRDVPTGTPITKINVMGLPE